MGSKEKNNKGQSTIEFIVTFTAAVGFIFLFLKMALNYTNGYMVHHATFMASRAYLVNDAEVADAARDGVAFKFANEVVFAKYLPTGLVKEVDADATLQPNHPAPDRLTVFTGVWIKFEQIFSLGFVGGKDPVEFRSESFLGREPTRTESYTQTCAAIMTVTGASCDKLATLDDNGG